jgi:hypothetical protein
MHVGLPFAPFVFWLFPGEERDEDWEEKDTEGAFKFLYTDYNIREGGSEMIIVPPKTWSRRTSKSILFFDMTVFEHFREPEEWPVFEEGFKWFAVEKKRKLVDAFDIEVGATLLLSARVGFSPGQFVDFITGWFGLDIAGDDTSGKDMFEKYDLRGICGRTVFQEGGYEKVDGDTYECSLKQYYRRTTDSCIILSLGWSAGESMHVVRFTTKKEDGEFVLKSFSYDEHLHHDSMKHKPENLKLDCRLEDGILKGRITGEYVYKLGTPEEKTAPFEFEFRLPEKKAK